MSRWPSFAVWLFVYSEVVASFRPGSGFCISSPAFVASGPRDINKITIQNSAFKCQVFPYGIGIIRHGRDPRTSVRLVANLQDVYDPEEYALIPLADSWTVRAVKFKDQEVGETFHPSIGVEAEGLSLYVEQLQLRERWKEAEDARKDFTIWDVGLGAAGNAIVALKALDDAGCKRVKMVSFDRTTGAATFALEHADKLTYVQGWERTIERLLKHGKAELTLANGMTVDWTLFVRDFPDLLESTPIGAFPLADAIMYDAFSPVRCPEMWSVSTLSRMREHLSGAESCMLSTSSRSTIVRVTLLSAGFFVGVGGSTGGTAFSRKEETTIAATKMDLLQSPLSCAWLERVQRSSAAEPLWTSSYVRAPASERTLGALKAHPQFVQQTVPTTNKA